MEVFFFASRNLENIKRGYEAKLWAVSKADASRIGKAKKYLKIGSRGLLYCGSTHSFTVPFIVKSQVDLTRVECNVWPEPWVLPFEIQPLGPPEKQLGDKSAKLLWPCLHQRTHDRGGVTAALNITGVTVFVPAQLSQEDWDLILRDLGV